jgi:hypothetical protein
MPPRPTNDTVRLADSLLERTRAGRVPWQPAEQGEGFEFVGSIAVVVIRSKDGDGQYPYVLDLYDQNGHLVDTLVTGYDPAEFGDEPRPWNETLEELYLAARRTGFRIEELAGSILEDLESPDYPATSADGP